MPKGYHPNVAAPGGSINVHPDFAATPSGLDAARARPDARTHLVTK